MASAVVWPILFLIITTMIDKQIETLRTQGEKLRREVRRQTVGYILAALGLVAGLAWNDAIKAMIEYFIPLSANGLLARVLYAVLITIVIVVVSAYLLRLTRKDEKEE